MSRSTLISVPDAEPHTTRRFCTTLLRSELDALMIAAHVGYRTLDPRRLAGAQKALHKLDHVTALADLSKKQREAGMPPKARHGGRA